MPCQSLHPAFGRKRTARPPPSESWAVALTSSYRRCRSRSATGPAGGPSAFERLDVPIVQAITSGMPREAWEVSHRGLTALDTAINVAIPEFDGRIITVPLSFKDRSDEAPGLYAPHVERAERIAGLAARLVRLRQRPRADMRVAFVLTNSSSKASQVGNAVGLDAPASLLTLLRAMRRDGYSLEGLPATSDALMTDLLARGTYDETHPLDPGRAQRFSRRRYRSRVRCPATVPRESAWKIGGVCRRIRVTRCAARTGAWTRRLPRRLPVARKRSRKSHGATSATTCSPP